MLNYVDYGSFSYCCAIVKFLVVYQSCQILNLINLKYNVLDKKCLVPFFSIIKRENKKTNKMALYSFNSSTVSRSAIAPREVEGKYLRGANCNKWSGLGPKGGYWRRHEKQSQASLYCSQQGSNLNCLSWDSERLWCSLTAFQTSQNSKKGWISKQQPYSSLGFLCYL